MAPGATQNEVGSQAGIAAIEAAKKLIAAAEATQVKAVSNGVSESEIEGVAAVKTPEDVIKELGMECDIKNLYQKEDARGRTTWTDKIPDDLDEAAENEITARYAILVRNKKSFDSRKTLEIDSIVVQSPLLKTVLSKVLKDYPGKLSQPMTKTI